MTLCMPFETPHDSTDPQVVVRRDGFRLVYQRRDGRKWPNTSDVTLERETTDAMGATQWMEAARWTLAPQEPGDCAQYDVLALKLLLDRGPVVKARE